MKARVFSVEERDRAREYILEKARSDPRVVSGASVGSDAGGHADRWSDLDLTFGLANGVAVREVVDDWTADLLREFEAAHLFDLTDRSTLYRVFLLPGNLQVDLSFTPGAAAEHGPRFRLLFGHSVQKEYSPPIPVRDLFGIGVHHAVRARYCIERKRPWQAEYWISGVRDQALALASARRGLEPSHARGFDQLPDEVVQAATRALVHSLERAELLRALRASVELLLGEAQEVRDLATRLERQLRELVSSEWP
jgi:hypothetical protein